MTTKKTNSNLTPCEKKFVKAFKDANEDIKQIRKSNAEFNKLTKGVSKRSPYYRSERIERKKRLEDAIKWRDVTLPLYKKMECK